ncbi:hypothetical protein EV286_105292 [Rhizobium sp. BK251]|nr:hypothetical protein EV286_105292 [Rhizobium sp. BK251]
MRFDRMIAALGVVLVGIAPAAAGSASNLKLPPQEAPLQLGYPYKDLPGVTAPSINPPPEYDCRSEVDLIRGWRDIEYRFDGMPRLVYVCERDGVIFKGTKTPKILPYQPIR